MAETRRLVLITGASAGIGAAFAEVYARNGWDLALTARRGERLTALADSLGARFGVEAHALPEDLADPEAPERLVKALAERGRHVDGLVNNAGYGVRGQFHRLPPAERDAFMQVLVAAVVDLSHAVLPGMRRRGYGRIINVASVMGLIPAMPGAVLYSAAKAFVVAFSEGLHLENRAAGVHVTALCPGLTRSEFHDVSGMTEEIAGAPPFMWADALPVAEAAFAAVEANRPLCVPGAANKAIVTAAKVLPSRLGLEAMQLSARRKR